MKRLVLSAMVATLFAGPATARQSPPAPSAVYGFDCVRLPGGGMDRPPVRIDPVHLRSWKHVCGDARLRALNDELATLGARIAAETAGVDGETGRPIDHYGDEQQAWQRRTLGACRDRACMATAYRARIADVKVRWRQALD